MPNFGEHDPSHSYIPIVFVEGDLIHGFDGDAPHPQLAVSMADQERFVKETHGLLSAEEIERARAAISTFLIKPDKLAAFHFRGEGDAE